MKGSSRVAKGVYEPKEGFLMTETPTGIERRKEKKTIGFFKMIKKDILKHTQKYKMKSTTIKQTNKK